MHPATHTERVGRLALFNPFCLLFDADAEWLQRRLERRDAVMIDGATDEPTPEVLEQPSLSPGRGRDTDLGGPVRADADLVHEMEFPGAVDVFEPLRTDADERCG